MDVLGAVVLGPIFRSWIIAMYNNIEFVIRVNVLKSFAIERLVRQRGPLSPLLHVLALEPLRRKLEVIGETPDGSTAYADDISIIVSDEGQLPHVENPIKGYDAVAEAHVN